MKGALLLGLTALAIAAGCGGSSADRPAPAGSEDSTESVAPPPLPSAPLTREQYFAAVRSIVDGPGRRASGLFGVLVVEQPPRECAAAARRFEQALDEIVDATAALSPPAHVAGLHGRFVVAARKAVGGARPALARAQAGELACGDELNAGIYGLPTTARAEAILAKIEAKGYVIFGE